MPREGGRGGLASIRLHAYSRWWQVELSALHSLLPNLKVGPFRSSGVVGFLFAHAGPPHLNQYRVERPDGPLLRPARAKRGRQRTDNPVDLNLGTRELQALKSQVQRCLPGRDGSRRVAPLPRRYVDEELCCAGICKSVPAGDGYRRARHTGATVTPARAGGQLKRSGSS